MSQNIKHQKIADESHHFIKIFTQTIIAFFVAFV